MASLDSARDLQHTYLKKQTASNDRFRMVAKNYAKFTDLAPALDKFIGNGSVDDVAIRLLAAFHAGSAGYDTASSPSYEAPSGISPVATWRGGPPGGATVIELASKLVSNPSDLHARRAFLLGRASQLTVIKRLYLASGGITYR